MQKSIALLASLGLALCLAAANVARDAHAATAYNTSSTSDEESAAAAATLHEALAAFHLMLAAVETSAFEIAAEHRESALLQLNDAVTGFESVVEAEAEADGDIIELRRDSGQYAWLVSRLEGLDVSLPETRTELAELAVFMTSRFQRALAEVAAWDLPEGEDRIHDLIFMSLTLQDIGVLASKVWREQPY